jgi:hypothetical protein
MLLKLLNATSPVAPHSTATSKISGYMRPSPQLQDQR